MAGDLQRNLGANLRAYREARGLSQEAFAHELGVHRTYMGAIERGERNPTLRTVERLARQIGMEPVELLEPSPAEQRAGQRSAGSDRRERG